MVSLRTDGGRLIFRVVKIDIFQHLAWVVAIVLTVSGFETTALAQSKDKTGPIRLYKGSGDPADKTDKQPAKTDINKDPAKEPQIAVQSLGDVDLSSVGSIGVTEGGLPSDMWDGSQRQLLEIMIPQLPASPTTATLRSLQRRLLLTAAAVPTGRKQGPSLLALRLEKLAESGWLDDVVDLVRQVPEGMADTTLARAHRDSLMLLGDIAGACQVVARYSVRDPSVDWQKSVAFCAAITGDSATLELTLELLREQHPDDEVFYALINELQHGEKARLKRIELEEPLDLALLRATNRTLATEITAKSDPGMLRTLAGWKNLDETERTKASIWAEAAGAYPTTALRDRLMRLSFGETARLEPDKYAAKNDEIFARALYFQAAAGEGDPDDRARLLVKAISLGRNNGTMEDVVRLNRRTLNWLQPAPSLKWFAPVAIRADLASGELTRANAWYGLLSSNPANRLDSRQIAPLVYMADPNSIQRGTTTIIGQWWLGESAKGDERRYSRAEFLGTLYEALNIEVPASLWRNLLTAPESQPGRQVSTGLLHALVKAGAGDRLGEVVLLSLIAIGNNSPHEIAASNLGIIVGALHRVGLENEARQIALETLLALEF